MKNVENKINHVLLVAWMLVWTLFSLPVTANDSEPSFYYSCGEKIQLKTVEHKILLRKKNDSKMTDCEAVAKNCLREIKTHW